MTPPTDPPPTDPPSNWSEHSSEPSERDALVDLLASCALDEVDAGPEDLDAAETFGIRFAEIEQRRDEFAAMRAELLAGPTPTDAEPETQDDLTRRRDERALAAAVAAAARPPKQRIDARDDAPVPVPRNPRGRLAPVLVAAGVLAVAGLGALVVSNGEGADDSATSSAEAQLDAATDGSGEGASTTAPFGPEAAPSTAAGPTDETVDAPTADEFDASGQAGTRTDASSPTVLELGSLESLNLAFDALAPGGGASRDGTLAEIGPDTSCVVQMAIEGYRAVATVRIGTTTHLVGETSSGDLAAFRTSDCTVVARRPG